MSINPAYRTPETLPFRVIEREFLGDMKVDLITDKFVFFIDPEEGDENGAFSMHRNEEGLPLVSNNCFASVGWNESVHLDEEELIWIGETTQYYLNLPEFEELKKQHLEA